MSTMPFRLARFFIDRLIIREMAINRISSVSFFNRKPSKVVPVEPEEFEDIEDVENEETVEVVEQDIFDELSVVNEYLIPPEIIHEVIFHYDNLCFIWIQKDDHITISWT